MAEIFIVEDDENIREMVLYALKAADFECKGFETSAELLSEIRKNIPEMILLDIMLPVRDGLSALKLLKSSNATKNLPVIMLTAKTEEMDKVKCLDMGADDYITKPFSVLELISRVRAVLRRCGINEEKNQTYSCGEVVIDVREHSVTAGDEKVELTYKEFALLLYLAKNSGFVLSRDKLMSAVWGVDFEGETRTVDMHIKTLRQKLGRHGGIIKTVRGVGYKVDNG